MGDRLHAQVSVTLLSFCLGRELGWFPFLCDKPGRWTFGRQLPYCSVAARRKGETPARVTAVMSSGGWGEDDLQFPGPVLRAHLAWASLHLVS